MTAIIQKAKNNKLLTLVIITYAALAVFMPNKALQAVQNTWYYIKEMIMIMPVILILTSLITAWVPRKMIEDNFGKESGAKGMIFSFLLGSFSAGPIYAAFPVCKMLMKKGASIANIIIILSTWAVIKVPMLINEAKFLSPKFMVIRWVLTTIAIFAMGFIASKLVKKESIPMDETDDKTAEGNITVVQEYCIGCGLCQKIAPNSFEMIDKKANIRSNTLSQEDTAAALEAMEKCTANAIKINLPSNIT